MGGQITRMKTNREQKWVRKPRVKSSNKYPNHTKPLDLTLNPSAICSHLPSCCSASECLIIFPLSPSPFHTIKTWLCTVNQRAGIMQRCGNWKLHSSSSLYGQTCVLYSSHYPFTAQQESSNCLRGWSLPPQGTRKKERHRSTISTLTYSKQSHLITKLKVITPQERAIMFFSFFFFNLWIAMSWQAIRLKHLNSTWRIYSPFLSSHFLNIVFFHHQK